MNDKVVEEILKEFDQVFSIWQFKDDKTRFIIFEKPGDIEGTLYLSYSKTKDTFNVDSEALKEKCDLIYIKEEI